MAVSNISPYEELAICGGTPVRTRPYPDRLPGASLIGEEELRELQYVVAERSPFRHYGLGKPCKVDGFEQESERLLGVKHALGVSSGTGALFCAAAALGIGPGDEVILPVFGWFSDYECIVAMGATPVFAEIDETLNLDPEDFERKITRATKAAIVIHYQGGPARMDEICAVASRHGVRIIEDCAQSFGGSYRGRMLGTIGDIGISSFQVNKMLTCGEGGILYTNDEKLYVRAVRYHDLGGVRQAFLERLEDKSLGAEEENFSGSQFRMSELHGAFMLAQLGRLPFILERCRKTHRRITEAFADCGRFAFRPTGEGDCGITAFLRFPTAGEAEFFLNALLAEGAPAIKSSACCNLLEKYPVKSGRTVNGYATFRAGPDAGAASDAILARYVPVGIGPLYTDEDVDDIIKSIDKVLMHLDRKKAV